MPGPECHAAPLRVHYGLTHLPEQLDLLFVTWELRPLLGGGRQSKLLHVISESESLLLPGHKMPTRLGSVTNTQDR